MDCLDSFDRHRTNALGKESLHKGTLLSRSPLGANDLKVKVNLGSLSKGCGVQSNRNSRALANWERLKRL